MIDSTSADYCVFAKGSMAVEGYASRPSAVHQRTNSQVKDHKEFMKKSNDSLITRSAKELSLLQFHEVDPHLQSNPFIVSGYRTSLSTKMCIESAFWLTNETVNIWSHVFGWMLFFGLTVYDLFLLNIHASPFDKLIVGLLLGCFQISMASSTMYHTFSCKSEKHFHCFLSFDLFGIALSLLAIYLSGIYYAFWCHPVHRTFYLSTVFFIFVSVMALQIPKLKASDNLKLISFVCWAAYGVIPTCHWVSVMGGWENPIVAGLFVIRHLRTPEDCLGACMTSTYPGRCPNKPEHFFSDMPSYTQLLRPRIHEMRTNRDLNNLFDKPNIPRLFNRISRWRYTCGVYTTRTQTMTEQNTRPRGSAGRRREGRVKEDLRRLTERGKGTASHRDTWRGVVEAAMSMEWTSSTRKKTSSADHSTMR